jgi:hypothetical protein
MPESRPEVTAFESRLAAMDRRLRELQEELTPDDGADALSDDFAREPEWLMPERPVSERPVSERPVPEPERPEREPKPGPEAARRSAPPATTQIDLLAQLYGTLIASVRELLGGYELMASRLAPAPAPLGEPGRGPDAPSEVTVSAGPFTGTAALHDFERALSELPGVRAVALRGYEAGDRAIVDVQLR